MDNSDTSRFVCHEKYEKPFGRCYWVVPDKLLAGYYPGARTLDRTLRKLHCLLSSEIRVFIDLTEPGDTVFSREALDPYEGHLSRMCEDAIYIRKSIPDLSAPAKEEMIDILDCIDEHINNGKAVYVHCRGGYGRTGTVIGCWLRRHNRDIDAIREIRRLRRKQESTFYRDSPQNSRQKTMIARWNYGE